MAEEGGGSSAGGDLVEISSEALEVLKYMNAVRDERAGAIATFSGTTRNSFQGRQVLQLEYEAYEAMAIRQMHAICSAARARWPLLAVSCAHRIGIVPIGHESVFVAVSSVHRADALLACHFIIDEIKSSVPIWKKEIYADGQVWKENAEFFTRQHPPCVGGVVIDKDSCQGTNDGTKDSGNQTGDQLNEEDEQELINKIEGLNHTSGPSVEEDGHLPFRRSSCCKKKDIIYP